MLTKNKQTNKNKKSTEWEGIKDRKKEGRKEGVKEGKMERYFKRGTEVVAPKLRLPILKKLGLKWNSKFWQPIPISIPRID